MCGIRIIGLEQLRAIDHNCQTTEIKDRAHRRGTAVLEPQARKVRLLGFCIVAGLAERQPITALGLAAPTVPKVKQVFEALSLTSLRPLS